MDYFQSKASPSCFKMGMSPLCPVGRIRFLGLPILCCFFALLLQSTAGKKLRSVIVVFRHGDRTPLSTFPSNPVKESIWPQGYGQLTQLGMKQQHELGTFIRRKYKNFLGNRYRQNEVYVRSTDYDRTIMSALTNLAGLYPPVADQIFNRHIRWHPIPVHSVPVPLEKLLVSPTHRCRRLSLLVNETFTTKKMQGELQSHMGFLAEMADKLGYDIKTLLDFTNQKLWDAYDALAVQKFHQKFFPAWATQDTMNRLKMILSKAVNAVFGVYKRKEKARLQGGILVKEILRKFTNVVQPTDGSEEPKLTMYSAHDMTLIALQSALDVYNQQLPPYAACYFFELYKENNGKYTVEMYYRNTTGGVPFKVILPACAATCPLSRFRELVAPIISDNVEEECNKM